MPEAYLYARCASDMAVLYWDKPSLAAADAVYTVFINDKKLADTKKTHCTIQNLVPDTDYTVQVQKAESGATTYTALATLPTVGG